MSSVTTVHRKKVRRKSSVTTTRESKSVAGVPRRTVRARCLHAAHEDIEQACNVCNVCNVCDVGNVCNVFNVRNVCNAAHEYIEQAWVATVLPHERGASHLTPVGPAHPQPAERAVAAPPRVGHEDLTRCVTDVTS